MNWVRVIRRDIPKAIIGIKKLRYKCGRELGEWSACRSRWKNGLLQSNSDALVAQHQLAGIYSVARELKKTLLRLISSKKMFLSSVKGKAFSIAANFLVEGISLPSLFPVYFKASKS